MKKTIKTAELLTPEGERLIAEGGIPWGEYPRPHLKRGSFVCLNGSWDFSVEGEDSSEKILVPFPPQSLLSGVGRAMPNRKKLWYTRNFLVPDIKSGQRLLLHVGSADRFAEVFLNGRLVGEHAGGYESFSFDITEFVRPENTLRIAVTDDHSDLRYPYGKQCEDRGGMWYTPVSGIWQTVWLEVVPELYISEIRVEADTVGATVTVETNDGLPHGGKITVDGREYELSDGRVRIEPEDPHLWSPEDPFLYRFTVKLGEDEAESYFALRTVTVNAADGIGRICLNGKPYFFHGLLDQGYFSDGIFLPASPEGFERDILTAKSLGFNMLRKHIKVEPELFYYACDRLGMIVFQDMINCGDYSFIRDTALPTVGFKKKNDKKMHRDPVARGEFIKCMEKTVRRLSFHPSVCYWTVFNEGWGQFDHAAAYSRLKALDPTRPVDSVSGWFTCGEKTVSDVISPHIYFKDVKLRMSKKPTVISEFGGYSFKVEGHSFNPVKNYGYGSFSSADELEAAISSLYLEQVLPAVRDGLSGAVYTQVSDVEDETNGLMTYDRRVTKVTEVGMKRIADALFAAFEGKDTQK